MKNEEKKQSLARSVIWLILLICLAWPMSWFLAPVYIFLMPFEALIPQCELSDMPFALVMLCLLAYLLLPFSLSRFPFIVLIFEVKDATKFLEK